MPSYPLQQILFLDIETVPQYQSHAAMPDEWQHLWQKKADQIMRNRETDTAESVYPRAGIYAEFGKIICISCGIIQGIGSSRKLLIKSFAGDDEKLVLIQFRDMLQKWSSQEPRFLCAHNGKEFDFPYICRRMLVNQVPIPQLLDIAGKKPWEINHLDTMELWKFGDFKSFTSLNLLAHTLGIPTPKDDIDGSMVWEVYWKEKNIDRIVTYCQKDVVTVAQILLRTQGESPITADQIEIKQRD